MKEICLSVIVPFYNVGRYLTECLESLLKATDTSGIQIILIDDGSEDESVVIAESYAKEYGFIEYHRTVNKGPSAARNMGIDLARGRYLFFCDSDDVVIPERLSKIVSSLDCENADVILWDADILDQDGVRSSEMDPNHFHHLGLSDVVGDDLTGKQIIKKQLEAVGDYPVAVWLGIYRKEFIVGQQLFFYEGILHEDELWVDQVYMSAVNVKYINETVYLYRIRPESITNSLDDNIDLKIESAINVFTALFKLSDEQLADDSMKSLYDANLTVRYLYLINRYDFYKHGYGYRVPVKLLWKRSGKLMHKYKLLIIVFSGIMHVPSGRVF